MLSISQLALGAPTASYFTPGDSHKHMSLFDQFKADNSKVYESFEEETSRFNVFVDNLRNIDQRNYESQMAGESATFGVTKFADLTPIEFQTQMLNYRPADDAHKTEVDQTIEPLGEGEQAKKDWTGKYTTPVKDQGQCGSCWAFSATEQIESDAMRTAGFNGELSAQQITSCDTRDGGCNGGNTETAYKYVQGAGGLVSEKSYPYVDGSAPSSHTTACSKSKTKSPEIKVSGYKTVKGESNMASYVGNTGPLSICVDASSWQHYKSGIMSSCGKRVDHCVQAVGVDTGAGFWQVRNSWGKSWGEKGHIRLQYGSNTCALTDDPTYTTVSRAKGSLFPTLAPVVD